MTIFSSTQKGTNVNTPKIKLSISTHPKLLHSFITEAQLTPIFPKINLQKDEATEQMYPRPNILSKRSKIQKPNVNVWNLPF